MRNNENIRECLEYLAKNDQYKVTEKLEEGSIVTKINGLFNGSSSSYIIDDINIDKKIVKELGKKFPYFEISDAFKERDEGLIKLEYKGRDLIPFSEIVEKREGECLEKSIVTQLVAQRKGIQSFLVSGGLLPEGSFLESHAYNIIQKKDVGYLLVDTQRPLVHEGGKRSPFIAPIMDINENGDLVLEKKWTFNEVYTLFD